MRSIRPIGPCLAAGLFLLSGCGGGGSSAPALPGTPGNLTATAGDGQVSLAWSAAAAATSYTVLYHEQNAPEAVHQQAGLTTGSSVVHGLLDEVPYVFSVQAVNGAGTATTPTVAATPEPAASLVSIAVTPTSSSIGFPAQVTFTAIGTYSDGSTPDITSLAQWVSDTPGVVMPSANGVTSRASGSASITAHLAGVASNAVTVTVGAKVTTGNPVGTTTTTTTTSAATVPVPMDVQSTLLDGTWFATQVAIAQQPAHGVATVTGPVVTYVPTEGYSGPDTIALNVTSQSAQIIEVGTTVLGANVNTNTDTRTLTLTVQ